MESAPDLRRQLEVAIADPQRRIRATEFGVGGATGDFPINAVWRDKNLGKLQHRLAELEEALSNLEADDAQGS
jgi:hypothetical protein